MMDLGFDHRAWVGDLCQKFEDICQQVDVFVNQTVGVGLGVGEKDIVPTGKEDSVKSEESASTQEQISKNICNDPLENCAVEAEDSPKDADSDTDAIILSQNQYSVKIEESESTQEQVDTNICNDSLESCAVKAEDSPKDADCETDVTDAVVNAQNQDLVVESYVNLETIAVTEKQTTLELSVSEDKNLSQECVFSEVSANKISSGEEESCCYPVNSIVSIVGVSESWSTLDSDKKDLETGFTLSGSDLSHKSDDTVNGGNNENDLLTESAVHEETDGWNLDQIDDIISPLETGEVNLLGTRSENSSMESINLSDGETLSESCIVVNSTPVYSFSSRPRKYKSYKKIIQDAFNSRKRIIKEYEQLEILYGNINDNPNDIKAMITNKTFRAEKSSTEESEWELVYSEEISSCI